MQWLCRFGQVFRRAGGRVPCLCAKAREQALAKPLYPPHITAMGCSSPSIAIPRARWPRIGLPALALALLAGCATDRPSAPPLSPSSPQRAPVAPLPPADQGEDHPAWEDWSASPGEWRYQKGQAGSVAFFGPAEGAPLVRLACESANRQFLIERPVPPGTLSAELTLFVRASGMERQLRAVRRTPPATSLVAQLAIGDPLLDAMAFSRGKFVIAGAGLPDLVLPSWAEVSRVIEDCRAPG